MVELIYRSSACHDENVQQPLSKKSIVVRPSERNGKFDSSFVHSSVFHDANVQLFMTKTGMSNNSYVQKFNPFVLTFLDSKGRAREIRLWDYNP